MILFLKNAEMKKGSHQHIENAFFIHSCFFSDTDKCAVSNGGCSHKCVNAEGGYKCVCPDPELRLALDNRTCHGKY